jgi:hypothetical protein
MTVTPMASSVATAKRLVRDAGLGWAMAYARATPGSANGMGDSLQARAATFVVAWLDPWVYRTRFLTTRQAIRIARSVEPLAALGRFREQLRFRSPSLATLVALSRPPALIEGTLTGRSGRTFHLSTEVEFAGNDPKRLTIRIADGVGPRARKVGHITIHAISPVTLRDHFEIYHPADRRDGLFGAIERRILESVPTGCGIANTLGGIMADGLALLRPYRDEAIADPKFGPRLVALLEQIDHMMAVYGSVGYQACDEVFPESEWVEGLRPYLTPDEKTLFQKVLAWTLCRHPPRIHDRTFRELILVRMRRRQGAEPVSIDAGNLRMYFVKGATTANAPSLDLDPLVVACANSVPDRPLGRPEWR